MDSKLFHFINGLATLNNVVDQCMILISSYFLYGFILIPVLMLFIKSKRTVGFVGTISVVIGLIINYLFSFLYYRNRPFVDLDVNLLIEKAASASFPSDQATIAFASALAVFLFYRKAGSIMLVLAFVLGFSRIYVGHHYPGDILGGFVVAFVSLFIAKGIILRNNNKNLVDQANTKHFL